jgi:hypothetical protein
MTLSRAYLNGGDVMAAISHGHAFPHFSLLVNVASKAGTLCPYVITTCSSFAICLDYSIPQGWLADCLLSQNAKFPNIIRLLKKGLF